MKAKERIEKLERKLGLNQPSIAIVYSLTAGATPADDERMKQRGFVKEGNHFVLYVGGSKGKVSEKIRKGIHENVINECKQGDRDL